MGMGRRILSATALIVGTLGYASGGHASDMTPAAAGPSVSANIAFTTDYVFRGFSQTGEDPTMQGGVDVSYGMFYAGIWASGLDFGPQVATAEVDFYTGIKKSYNNLNFDFGVIYYAYPGAEDGGAELNYVELKAGVSTSIDKLGIGATVFYSPEYTGETGDTVTVEGKASYEFASFRGVTPTVSALVGTTISTDDDPAFSAVFANGDDSYVYWNAGLTLSYDKLSLDFRYWDTDVSDAGGFCSGALFQCDERFTFTAAVTF